MPVAAYVDKFNAEQHEKRFAKRNNRFIFAVRYGGKLFKWLLRRIKNKNIRKQFGGSKMIPIFAAPYRKRVSSLNGWVVTE